MIARSAFFGWEFERLRDFLLANEEVASRRIAVVENKGQEGEFNDYGGYESDLDEAFVIISIAVRAVYHELWSLVEHEMQWVALEILSLTRKRGMAWNDPTEMPYKVVVSIVEKHFGFSVSDLPGHIGAERVRAVVNALKHRKGRKRDEGEFEPATVFPDYYRLDGFKARDDMAEVQKFLNALSGKTSKTNADKRRDQLRPRFDDWEHMIT